MIPPFPEAGSLIAGLPRPAADQLPADYEFSIRMFPGGIERWGRFGVWLSGTTSEAFQPIRDWLTKTGAPAQAVSAQADSLPPGRQGVAVSIGESGIEFKLYLQGTDPENQARVYTAVRWTGTGSVKFSRYTFYFSPETLASERPQDLAPACAREIIQSLADDEQMKRSSGFWLRHDNDELKQLDLAFPWHPKGETLPGLMAFADRFGLSPESRSFIGGLPIRHIALPTGTGAQSVTLYASSPLNSTPLTESELQQDVCTGALRRSVLLRKLFASSEGHPSPPKTRTSLDHFYSGDLGLWRAVLGNGMHFHHAIFDLPCSDADDMMMLQASRRAVSELYPFISPGDRVYDVGCGWGGPLAMLNRERKCCGLGLTIASHPFSPYRRTGASSPVGRR